MVQQRGQIHSPYLFFSTPMYSVSLAIIESSRLRGMDRIEGKRSLTDG
jgi:hypothetical protein